MSDTQTTSPKHRSPSYPAFDLQTAISKARMVFNNQKRHPAPVDVTKKALGYEPKSSNALRAIATLISYGLIEEEGSAATRQVKLTELGLKILLLQPEDNPERIVAIQEAALNPVIYRDMVQHWDGDLPGDPIIENYLNLKKGFNESVVKSLIKDFKATLKLANLDLHGILSPEEPDSGDTMQEAEEDSSEDWNAFPVKQRFNGLKNGDTDRRPPTGGNPMNPPTASNTQTFTLNLPLPGGKIATLQVPSDIEEDGFSFLSRYLDFMKEAFVKKPAEPSHVAPAGTADMNGSEKT